jgi:hypothetical protein
MSVVTLRDGLVSRLSFVTVIVVMLDVVLRCLFGMARRMHTVPVRQMGMMGSLFVITGFVVLGGLPMVLCGALMMFCVALVMFHVGLRGHRILLSEMTWARHRDEVL